MSNEEIIEEILTESYSLGINREVFTLMNSYKETMSMSDAFQKAFHDAKEELLLYNKK